jgi:hypothetical protein
MPQAQGQIPYSFRISIAQFMNEAKSLWVAMSSFDISQRNFCSTVYAEKCWFLEVAPA